VTPPRPRPTQLQLAIDILFGNKERNLTKKEKLEILQSLGGLYDGLAFYALHWSYASSL